MECVYDISLVWAGQMLTVRKILSKGYAHV